VTGSDPSGAADVDAALTAAQPLLDVADAAGFFTLAEAYRDAVRSESPFGGELLKVLQLVCSRVHVPTAGSAASWAEDAWDMVGAARAGDPLGLLEETWRCMVCGDMRLYHLISVAHRPPALSLGLPSHWNVSYCNDRDTCTAVATAAGVWPAPPVVLQAADRVQLTAAAVSERVWASHRTLPDTAVGILTWLRSGPATVEELCRAYTEPAAVIVGVCCTLAEHGMIEVAA
jgi:hypothetical protein